MKKNILLVALITILSLHSQSQTITHNNDIWFHGIEKLNFKNKYSITIEGTFRFANGFSEPQQLFIRPSFDYKFTKNFTGSVGYTYYNTYRYGLVPLNSTSIPEHHGWIQGQFTHKVKKWTIVNRLRDENRMVGVAVKNSSSIYEVDHFEYRNRLRYMFMATYPLITKQGKPFINGFVGDELFMNIGNFSGVSFLNQNRIIAGFGFIVNPNLQFQLAYIHQNIWNKSNTIEEINPTLRISVIHNLNF